MLARLTGMLLMLCAIGGAWAAPTYIEQSLNQPRLAGKGVFTWFGLRIYEAELWVGEQGYLPGAPFVLELRYSRKLDGVRIAAASADEMEKLGAGTPAQRAAWLPRMKEIFPDVSEGTRISGVSLAGGGVQFYLDGKPLAKVADPEFARAFFAIWLDPKTSAGSLRTALLKDAAPR
jgi:hypothetical protein